MNITAILGIPHYCDTCGREFPQLSDGEFIKHFLECEG